MDDFTTERDEQLIEERGRYEEEFLSRIVDEMMESDALDRLIAQRLKYIDDHFDFEPSSEYERLEMLYYQEHELEFREIDPLDEIEFYDDVDYEPPHDYYPDLEVDIPVEDCPKYDYDDEELAEMYETIVEEAFIEYHDEDRYLEELIKQHIQEEKDFLNNLAVDSILEDSHFERMIDELIFGEIGMDYEPDYFDYSTSDYWFDRPDESIIDPFDSLGDVDYPDEEAMFSNKNPVEMYHEDLQNDFERYDSQLVEGFDYDDIPIPEGDLILEPPEEVFDFVDNEELRNQKLIENQEKIETIFKDYFTRDDTLDNIIKQKLKEKKFN